MIYLTQQKSGIHCPENGQHSLLVCPLRCGDGLDPKLPPLLSRWNISPHLLLFILCFCAVFAPHAAGEIIPVVKYGVLPSEFQYPSFVKHIGVHHRPGEIDGLVSLAAAFLSLIAIAPQSPIHNPILVGKEHRGVMRFVSRLQNLGKSHGNTVSFWPFRFTRCSYPAPVAPPRYEGNRSSVVLDHAFDDDHIGTVGKVQVHLSQFDPKLGPFFLSRRVRLLFHKIGLSFDGVKSSPSEKSGDSSNQNQSPVSRVCWPERLFPIVRLVLGVIAFWFPF